MRQRCRARLAAQLIRYNAYPPNGAPPPQPGRKRPDKYLAANTAEVETALARAGDGRDGERDRLAAAPPQRAQAERARDIVARAERRDRDRRCRRGLLLENSSDHGAQRAVAANGDDH